MSKNKNVKNTCSRRVKMARVGKDMKQVDLAAAVSVDTNIEINQHAISSIERGIRFVKDIELLALADVLNVHPMWLMFGDNVPEKYK